jgi:hypothetical protein
VTVGQIQQQPDSKESGCFVSGFVPGSVGSLPAILSRSEPFESVSRQAAETNRLAACAPRNFSQRSSYNDGPAVNPVAETLRFCFCLVSRPT